MPMTPEAKARLSGTIRGLRERLLGDLHGATEGAYRLSADPGEARLDEAAGIRRARLDRWLDEQVRTVARKERGAARERFRDEVEKEAAYTLLNRLVFLRLAEARDLTELKVVIGGWESQGYREFREWAPGLCNDETEGYAPLLELAFGELAQELPGLYGDVGLTSLVPVPPATLRAVIEALDHPELASCWTDDMTLGWVYQYWNDPEREALDAKLNSGGKVEPHEIASKTQMFTERYMVDWLLQNSLGPMWLAMCRRQGWTPAVEADGTLDDLEKRREDWRGKRDRGEVELTELMPLYTDAERRWAYYVLQPIPDDAVEQAPESVRELRILDPAVGSGHFLVVAFDLLVALYREEAVHRGEQDDERWSDRAIVERILEHNLHGIDLDPRAVQIAAAALWLKARQVCPKALPAQLGLVASDLRLASLPDDDPALAELRRSVEEVAGIPGELTQQVVNALKGADHLGSLLKVDAAVDEAIAAYERRASSAEASQGGLFDGHAPQQVRLPGDEARRSLLEQIETFLDRHTGGDDLGLRLRGEQLAAGVRFARMVREGSYDLVVGNPPYQGTSKMVEPGYVKKHYPRGKADLYAAFVERALQLARSGGVSALLTMRNWMFIKQYAELRGWLLKSWDLRALGDFAIGAFDEVPNDVLSVVVSVFRKAPPAKTESVASQPTPPDDRSYDRQRTARKRAAVLCQVGRHEFDPDALKVVPEWPLVYWWTDADLQVFKKCPLIGSSSPARATQGLYNNVWFVRRWYEIPATRIYISRTDSPQRYSGEPWVPFVMGADGAKWFEPLRKCASWGSNALVGKVHAAGKTNQPAFRYANEQYFFNPTGVAFASIGASFSARAHAYVSVFDAMGRSIFDSDVSNTLCLLNSKIAARIMEALNPTVHFHVGDVNRVPLLPIADSADIFARVKSAFWIHESHREPSVEYRQPGPSPWRFAQDWAQAAVDRPEGASLSPYDPEDDPEPPTDHVSYALGAALGRFGFRGEGILDPGQDDLSHALPGGILFLDGTLDPDSARDDLGHSAASPLLAAWTAHGQAIDPRTDLRTYLRLKFFTDIHRKMYENRPIHWPVSSQKKTFVAWITIHRWTADTLRALQADHLLPARTRLDGELDDLRATRDGVDREAARAAETRFVRVQGWLEELNEFIAAVQQCAEQGPPPTDSKYPDREQDARYDPDLDDGVMINSAALWPLLLPQWKDPKKWWKELATARGRKDYDWAHLAARYFPERVDGKCQEDPSLAVAHGCFWRYHPERAYAWELRLQDEIAPDFTIDEADSDACREALFEHYPELAEEIRETEDKRRERKRKKEAREGKSSAGPLFDRAADRQGEDP